MGKHFISVLGTGGYMPCTYGFNGVTYRSMYVQEAILKTVIGEMKEGDRITIFLTEAAEKQNWKDRAYNGREIENINKNSQNKSVQEGEKRPGLQSILHDSYGELVEMVKIPTGETEEEMDEIFEIIYENIEPEEDVYFDITHGLRNIPMQALTILNYARVLKRIKIAGVYYGAFEVINKETNIAPIFNLSRYNEILEWTSAADAFVNGGSSRQIKILYDRKEKEIKEKEKNCEEVYKDNIEEKELQKEKIRQEKEELNKLKNPIEGVVNLTSCLETGRGKDFPKVDGNCKQSIYGAYADFKKSMEAIDSTQKGIIKPLKPLFGEIEDSIKNFDTKGNNASTGKVAIEWAIKHHLLQQGYTALEETMKTVLCEYCGLEGLEERERDRIVGSAMKTLASKHIEWKRSLKNDTSKEFIREDVFAYWVKEYGKELSEEEKKYAEKIIKELPVKYANLSNNVSDSRNSINHFGFQKNGRNYTKFETNLEKYYKEFQELCLKIEDEWELSEISNKTM